MTKFSDNDSPSLLFTEQGSSPSTPAASHQRLFIRSSDHLLCYINSSGTVTPVSSGGSGSITSSGYTQTSARLLGRTTASTGAIEEITVGTGLSLSAGSLTATGGGGLTASMAGYDTIGGTWTATDNRKQYCKKVTFASTTYVLGIEAYIRPNTDATIGYGVALLADNSNAPGVLIGGTLLAAGTAYFSNSSSMPGAGRWYGMGIGKAVAAGDYWICFISGTTIDIANDGSGSDQTFTPSSFIVTGAYPSAWTITTTSTKYSIRAAVLA